VLDCAVPAVVLEWLFCRVAQGVYCRCAVQGVARGAAVAMARVWVMSPLCRKSARAGELGCWCSVFGWFMPHSDVGDWNAAHRELGV
jgi:hypothetical protein